MKRVRLQAAASGPDNDPLSFSEIRELLCCAICAKAGADTECYVIDVYPASVVYQLSGDETLYQCSYSIDAVEAVTLGEAAPVEREVTYVPLQAASGQLLAAVDGDSGFRWRIQICKYGQAVGQPIIWPREPLVAAIPLYEGARVFCLNDTQHVAAKDRPMGKSVREIVGWVENVCDTGTGLEGDFVILQSAKWLRDMAVDSFEHGKTDLFGFSHDVQANAKIQMIAGKSFKVPTEIMSVDIDVVYRPTNDGKMLRMTAATNEPKEKQEMKREQLVAAVKTNRPELYLANQDAIDGGSMTDEQLLNLLAAAPVMADAGAETLKQMQLLAAQALVRETLAACGLPEPVQAKLRMQFTGQIVTETTLQAAVKAEKEMVDQLTATGVIHGVGQIRVVRESGEKLQAAMDGMLNVTVSDSMRDVQPFTSLRAAYTELTGDTDVRGFAEPGQRLQAAFDSSTFSFVLGNALYRRMINDYRETTDFGLSRIVSNVRNARDFRPLQAIRIQYFGDIPDITPETDDYTDLGTVTDEKVEYSLNQKGGIITITRKMIINDDLTAVNRIVSRLPRAARRTKAKRAWNKFINNDTYKGDSTAIFTAGHNNLGSAAYSITSAVAARAAIAKQTEPGSGERLYLRPQTLAIPTDLWDTAVQVNQTRGVPGSANLGNSMFQYFGINNENIIEIPFMTDVNDWLMFADPKDVEMLEVAYLNGQQEPEMFVADNPQMGQFFVADKLQYKIRDEYEFEFMDFRGAYKAIVP